MAGVLGFKDVFDFYYQNHDMNGISYLDLRGRLERCTIREWSSENAVSIHDLSPDPDLPASTGYPAVIELDHTEGTTTHAGPILADA